MPGTAEASLVCPECGRPPGEAARRPWRVWSLWPVGVAAALVLGISLMAEPRGWNTLWSLGSRGVCLGSLTVGDLRAIAAGGRDAGDLRRALADPLLVADLPAELTRLAVDSVAAEEVDSARTRMFGWPAAWLTMETFVAAEGSWPPPLPQSWEVTFEPWGDSAPSRAMRRRAGHSVSFDVSGLACDLVVPAGALALAGAVGVGARGGRWRVLAAVGLCVLAFGWPRSRGGDTAALTLTPRALRSSLASLREKAGTSEGVRGVADMLLGSRPEVRDAERVLLIVSFPRVTENPFAVADLPRVVVQRRFGIPWFREGPAPRWWVDEWGVHDLSWDAQGDPVQRSVMWRCVGLVAGVPAGLWVVWAGVRGLWGWWGGRRWRGGHCRGCGYDLRGIAAGAGGAGGRGVGVVP